MLSQAPPVAVTDSHRGEVLPLTHSGLGERRERAARHIGYRKQRGLGRDGCPNLKPHNYQDFQRQYNAKPHQEPVRRQAKNYGLNPAFLSQAYLMASQV